MLTLWSSALLKEDTKEGSEKWINEVWESCAPAASGIEQAQVGTVRGQYMRRKKPSQAQAKAKASSISSASALPITVVSSRWPFVYFYPPFFSSLLLLFFFPGSLSSSSHTYENITTRKHRSKKKWGSCDERWKPFFFILFLFLLYFLPVRRWLLFFLFTPTRSILQPVYVYRDPLDENTSPVTTKNEKQRAVKE